MHSAHQLLDLAEALERRAHAQLLAALGPVEELGVERGAEDAGGDRVDDHALRPPLDGERAGEAGDARLARRVGRHLEEGDEGVEGGHVHDAPVAPLDHGPAEDLAGAQGAGEVRLQDAAPLLLGEVEDGRALDAARAVDEDVDLPERGEDGVPRLLERGAVGDVGGGADRLPAARLDLLRRRLDRLRRARAGHDVGAGLGHAQRERAADPGGAAEDDRHLARQVQRGVTHALPPIARRRVRPARASRVWACWAFCRCSVMASARRVGVARPYRPEDAAVHLGRLAQVPRVLDRLLAQLVELRRHHLHEGGEDAVAAARRRPRGGSARRAGGRPRGPRARRTSR